MIFSIKPGTRRLPFLAAAFTCALLLPGLSSCAAPQTPPAAPASPGTRGVKVERDVSFFEVKNPQTGNTAAVKLDVYAPESGQGKRPGVILVHGGGWVFGDKSFYAPMGVALARKGYVAVSVNYRLAPLFKYPAQVDDVQRAVRWMRANAAKYNLDPDRIGAIGDSAGGYLVAMLGMRDTRDNADTALSGFSSRVQCVVNFYGPGVLTLKKEDVKLLSRAEFYLTSFLGKKPGEDDDLYRDASPSTYATKTSAPMLLIHGTADDLVPDDQSKRLYDALKAAGADATLVLLHKYGHGFLNPAAPGPSGALIDEFLARCLKP